VCLADPERAIGEVDRRLAAAKGSPDVLAKTGLIELVSILAQPTEDERIRNLGLFGHVAWPRDDD
jgi:hypothetical protein